MKLVLGTHCIDLQLLVKINILFHALLRSGTKLIIKPALLEPQLMDGKWYVRG